MVGPYSSSATFLRCLGLPKVTTVTRPAPQLRQHLAHSRPRVLAPTDIKPVWDYDRKAGFTFPGNAFGSRLGNDISRL